MTKHSAVSGQLTPSKQESTVWVYDKDYASWIPAAGSTNFHFYIQRTIEFNKTIEIIVPPNFAGPPGWNYFMIIMGFDQDAIQSSDSFIPTAWRYVTVYSACTINIE